MEERGFFLDFPSPCVLLHLRVTKYPRYVLTERAPRPRRDAMLGGKWKPPRTKRVPIGSDYRGVVIINNSLLSEPRKNVPYLYEFR